MHTRGQLDEQEWHFFIKGGPTLESYEPNPASDWLVEKSWREIVRASDLPALKGFKENFKSKVSVLLICFCSSYYYNIWSVITFPLHDICC